MEPILRFSRASTKGTSSSRAPRPPPPLPLPLTNRTIHSRPLAADLGANQGLGRMQPIIKLENFSKTYHTGEVDVHAVRRISLDIMPGEFVAIMGASGSGKSTLMNTIGCLDRPTGGKYYLDGIDV